MSAQEFYEPGKGNYQQGNYQQGNYQQGQGNYPPPAGYPPPQGLPPQQSGYSMMPSQPYAPPAGNPEYGGDNKWGDTAPFSQQTAETGQRFRPKSRLQDPIFLILFICNLGGWAAVSGIAIKSFVQFGGLNGGVGGGATGAAMTLNYHTVYLLLLVCALAVAVGAIWLMLLRAFAKIILEVTLVMTVILNIGICIWYFINKYWSGAIIFLIIALFSIISYFFMRSRIPLTKLLLQTTIDITKHHPSVYLIVFLGMLVEAAIACWYTFTVIAIYVKYTPDSPACQTTSCSSGKVAGLIVYTTFSFYWTSQVVANVVLCTLAGGIFGGWYYYGPRMNDGTGLPKNASGKAFGRATTLSLGSIAFGSLIVAILETIEAILRAAQSSARQDGDTVMQILSCCAVCCLGCIRSLLEWFNKYAYIEIALYGKAYIPAAKDTWTLMKDRGIDALAADSLVSIVIMWGAYLNGFLCGLFGYVYLRFTKPDYNREGQYTAPVILFAFLIGINISSTIGRAIDAGTSTIFVGLGEHPMILAQRAPALFDLIRQAYPRVVQGIPHNDRH